MQAHETEDYSYHEPMHTFDDVRVCFQNEKGRMMIGLYLTDLYEKFGLSLLLLFKQCDTQWESVLKTYTQSLICLRSEDRKLLHAVAKVGLFLDTDYIQSHYLHVNCVNWTQEIMAARSTDNRRFFKVTRSVQGLKLV